MDQEDRTEDYHDSLMHEYVQLREELRLYLSRKRGFDFVLGVIAAMAALSATLSEPAPLLLMSFLPVFLIDEQTRRLDAIHRIASYIRSQIEPKLKGLNWETFGNEFLGDSSHFSFSVHGLDVIILSLLAIIQFCFAAVIWHSNTTLSSYFNDSNDVLLFPIGIILLSTLLAVILRFHSIKPRGEKYVEKWNQIATGKTVGSGGDAS